MSTRFAQRENLPMNSVIQLRLSQSEKPTVRSGRAKNADYRQREYLTEGEIDSLLATAGNSRSPTRDRLLILMALRHALRVSELVDIRWQQIDLDTATVHIRRAKNGTPGIHGLEGDELRLLRALRREHPHADFVFLSERKAPLSIDGAQKLIERLGESAELPFPIHAHMLCHAAGYALPAYGPELEGFDYPFPVQHFAFTSQRQSLQMAYLDVKPDRPNGQTAVLLHGKNFCAATWEPTIKHLVAAGYRVIAPDQIGFCKSSKPAAYQV